MSVYDQRPWLGLYAPGVPHEIELEHDSMLAAFTRTAGASPQKTALQYFEAPISYGELDTITDSLAAGLQAEGFQHGDRLAVDLQNIPQFVIAMIATWKAGGIVVSVSPMLKHKELSEQLTDSGAVALITLESLWDGLAREVVSDCDVRTVITTSELDYLGKVPPLLAAAERKRDDQTLDLVELVEEHRGRSPDTPALGPGETAFLTYTSGTTGPSKGAMNSHGNVVFNAQAYRD
jgi:long-chain acyl-CoA synthetase